MTEIKAAGRLSAFDIGKRVSVATAGLAVSGRLEGVSCKVMSLASWGGRPERILPRYVDLAISGIDGTVGVPPGTEVELADV